MGAHTLAMKRAILKNGRESCERAESCRPRLPSEQAWRPWRRFAYEWLKVRPMLAINFNMNQLTSSCVRKMVHNHAEFSRGVSTLF